ncbi:hypothetical protein [Yersinia ruckeri]|uniref:hypothetical protein n=1 Tax=Yersinia ruckeri TaxID=29486 RepID=UPI0022377743|nr:hypothetical protein [Yersinia ruckeri]MCW6598710.1 hypothetical protein [Yersinia ruckeri]
MSNSDEINLKMKRLLALLDHYDNLQLKEPYLQSVRKSSVIKEFELRSKAIEEHKREILSQSRKQIHSITLYSKNFPLEKKSDDQILAEGYSGNNPILKQLFAKKS